MKNHLTYSLPLLMFLLVTCNNKQPDDGLKQQDMLVFPQGEIITSENFTGTAYLQRLLAPDSIYQTSIGNVTFTPGARTNWHKHPGGQILLVTAGKGYYQEKGRPAQMIRQGAVVNIAPYLEHWHGAAADTGLTHIAISLNLEKGGVVWLQPVTEEEYSNL